MRLFASLGMLSLLACGGATTTPLLDGGGSDGGPPGDAHADVSPPGQDGGPPDCTKLLADLDQKQQAATQCCLTCNSLQCTQQIDGLCCPLTVTSGDSLASKDYLSALQAVKDANCPVNCPAVACATKPSDNCMQNGTCAQQ